jgi:hypothetical protein
MAKAAVNQFSKKVLPVCDTLRILMRRRRGGPRWSEAGPSGNDSVSGLHLSHLQGGWFSRWSRGSARAQVLLEPLARRLRWAMAGPLRVTAVRSRTAGRPTKKPADERIQLSSLATPTNSWLSKNRTRRPRRPPLSFPPLAPTMSARGARVAHPGRHCRDRKGAFADVLGRSFQGKAAVRALVLQCRHLKTCTEPASRAAQTVGKKPLRNSNRKWLVTPSC